MYHNSNKDCSSENMISKNVLRMAVLISQKHYLIKKWSTLILYSVIITSINSQNPKATETQNIMDKHVVNTLLKLSG